jgi:hypothetical protein
VAEFRHQPLLILRQLDFPLCDENLAVTRFHPKKTHRQIMPDGGRTPAYRLRVEAASSAALEAREFFLCFCFGSGTDLRSFGPCDLD